jgi:GntP family gluconate:H+ symporter
MLRLVLQPPRTSPEMTALLIVLLGAALVLAGVIGLRLHAFLALIGAALVVVWLAPKDARMRNSMRAQAVEVADYDPAKGQVIPTPATAAAMKNGTVRLVKRGGTQVTDAQEGRVTPIEGTQSAIVSDFPPNAVVEAGDWLVPAAEWPKAQKAAAENPGEVVAKGFGDACASIGLLIALAAVIGECLMRSGAAERIVLALRNALGERRTPLAFLGSGYVLGIPVFFDTVFYLLMPLGKALRRKTGRDYVLYIMCIVAGATMTHSLVPPTPGPLFVADAFGVSIGTMILGGSLVGAFAVAGGYTYALWANKRWDVPLREVVTSGEDVQSGVTKLPPLLWSLAPIVLPVGLIAAAGIVDTASGANQGFAAEAVELLGNKNIALALGTIAALALFARARAWNWHSLAKPIGVAIEGGATILLITAAGGAFGYAMRVTDIAGVVAGWFQGDRTWLLPAAFMITALIRTAQGSATVAMVTAAGILAPIASTLPLGYHPVYLAIAVGCGSKPFSWMNDSGFWIISRMTGMTEGETLRTASAVMAIMGVVGLLATMLGAWLLPFAK